MTGRALALYAAAALAEIGGCFAVWAWMRAGRSALWLVPGGLSLALFAWLLALSPAAFAGRAYAAYGGIYVAASVGWLLVAEGVAPTRTDLAGALLAIAGCLVILWGARPA